MCKLLSSNNEIRYVYQLYFPVEENEVERYFSKFIKWDGSWVIEPILSTSELDPFQNLMLAWCTENVCEEIVEYINYNRRKFHM